MRCPVAIAMLASLLCSGCDSMGEKSEHDHRWFNTYQTDSTCQGKHLPAQEDPFERGPTGRAHPF